MMYLGSGIIVFFVIINYFLGLKLYDKPKNDSYFNNVTKYDFEKDRYILPQPKYVIIISILVRNNDWHVCGAWRIF